MSKYIGTPVVNLSVDTVDVTGDITATDSTPELILLNDTHEDTDGGREGKVTFKGEQSGGEVTVLAQIQSGHDGTSDDQKGDLIFKTNDGSDGSSPTERLRIDSAGVTTFTGNIANTSGDLTLDIVGDLIIDVDGGDVKFKDDGTEFSQYYKDGNDLAIYSSISDGDIKFQGLDGGSVITAMTIDMSEGGKVGIGTTSPDGQLHLFTSDASITPDADADDLIIEANGASGITIGSSASSVGSIRFADSGSPRAGMIYYDHVGNAMRLYTGATERMRIDSSGNLNIGSDTNVGYGPLQIGSTSSASTIIQMLGSTSGNNTIHFGDATSGAERYRGYIQYAHGNDSMQFGTVAAERMRIDNGGKILIGKTSADATVGEGIIFGPANVGAYSTITSGNTWHVHDTSAYKFYVNSNGGIYNYQANNSNLSDEREKKNIETLDDKWDAVKAWSLKKFHYNSEEDSDPKKIGVIAQDLETNHPELITEYKKTEDETRKSVKEQQMMWMAIKALQEAMAKIETLETKVAALEGE